MRNGENALDRRNESDVVGLVVIVRHPGEADQEEQCDDDQPDHQIRLDQNGEIRIPDRDKFRFRQGGALRGVKRIHLRLDEVHGHIHADQGAHRIEGLGKVQTPRRGLLGAHGKNVGIGARFEEGEPAGQNEIGDEERVVAARHFRRKEEKRAKGIQRKSQQNAGLVGVFPDEHCRGKRHGEISAVEGDLHQGSVGYAHSENFRKRLDHRVGDVVGESPECEARGDQNEGKGITDSVLVQKRLPAVFHDRIHPFRSGGSNFFFLKRRISCRCICNVYCPP